MLDPWTDPRSYDHRFYDTTVADRHMGVITKARGSMIHPKVEAEWDEAYAPEPEQADEPSGAIGWIVTVIAVFIMGVTIALQI